MNKRNICSKARICRRLIAVLAVALAIVSCKPGIPSKYLEPDEMADILYDYHLAEGMASASADADSIALRTYRTSILEHHGVKEADFDSSMVYYTRHAELLQKVYTQLQDRLNRESTALGGSSGMGDFASADTANVWRDSQSFVLSPYAATNRFSFELKADTAWHEGDRMILDFDAQFIYQDGMRDAVAVMAVTYDNDSTEYVNNSVMSSSHYQLQINNTGRLRIKSVRGFWLLSDQPQSSGTSTSTLKLLVVNNVRLIRMHTAKPDEAPAAEAVGEAPDSARVERKDSVKAQPVKTPPMKLKPIDRQLKPVPNQQLKPMEKQQLKPLDKKLKLEQKQ